MAGAQFGVTLGGSTLIFLTAHIYALIHLLTLLWRDSSGLAGGAVDLTFLTLSRAFDSGVGECSNLRNLSCAVRHLVVSRLWSALFLASYHLFFHMLNTLLRNNLSPGRTALATVWRADALRLLR